MNIRAYLILFLSFLFFSCQQDLEDENTRIDKLPVFEIQIPPTMQVGFEYQISFKYALPNGCYSFYSIDIENDNLPSENVRLITAFAEVAINTNCIQVYTEETYSFKFTPEASKIYLFKFWIGQDDTGIDQFEEIQLLVE
jgi:hypothetical protein